MIDKLSTLDTLTDYANEFGDLALLDLFCEWQNTKMGHTNNLDSKIKLLSDIVHELRILSDKRTEPSDKNVGYCTAITDSIMIIINKMVKL